MNVHTEGGGILLRETSARRSSTEAAIQKYRGRVEGFDTASGFLVVSGWAAGRDGSAPGHTLTLTIDQTEFPIQGLFPRPDLQREGISSAACGFRADIPRPVNLSDDAKVSLTVGGEIVHSVEFGRLSTRSFKPTACFDAVSSEIVSGWVYDPNLWRATSHGTRIELIVGEYRLPLELNVRRHDLPFSAARTGRPLGFQVHLRQELEAAYDADVVKSLCDGRSYQLLLLSDGSHVADERVKFDSPVDFASVVQAKPQAAQANQPPTAPVLASGPSGYIDFYGYSEGLGGWLLSGWIRLGAHDDVGECTATASFEDEVVHGKARCFVYSRADVESVGKGLLIFVPAERAFSQPLTSLSIRSAGNHAFALSDSATRLAQAELLAAFKQIVRSAGAGDGPFGQLIARPIFDGVDTLAKLSAPVFLEIDEVVAAPDAGVVLIGWFLDPTNAVAAIRLRAPGAAAVTLHDRWLVSARPDVKDAYGSRFGLEHTKWGFVAFGPTTARKGLYLEFELHDGTLAFKPVPPATRTGVAGIRRILTEVPLGAHTVADACANVLGPPVIAINHGRLASNEQPREVVLGDMPSEPRCSIVIPLYGRIDFMMYQLALMSEHGMVADELIYVLDEPAKKSELLELARSSFVRFGLPMKLVLPTQNLGFAGASNAGLDAARGRYVCFLNSDVMPHEPRWLDTLTGALDADPTLGLVGARLLFEDGTVQHDGMDFERHPQFGDWLFPYHPGKGRLPAAPVGLRRVPAVTGACMVMRRALALKLGGFDAEYVIGDFEDADLCRKVQAEGLHCAVHDGAALYHLERQSQGTAANTWRMNLTLVNAWTYNQRWQADSSGAGAEI